MSDLLLSPIITRAGLDAAVLANQQTVAFKITHISFSDRAFEPTTNETSLPEEKLRVEIASATNLKKHNIQLRAVAKAASGQGFACRSIGFWANNTLFAVASNLDASTRSTGFFYIHDNIETNVTYSLALDALNTDNIEVVVSPELALAEKLIDDHIKDINPHSQYAPLNSPAFTGTPTATTPAQSANNGQIATTEFVKTAIAALVGSAPAELDTLEELAAMLAENGDLRQTLLQKLAEKAPLSHRHTTADIEGLQTALDEAGKKGLPVGSIVAFPRAVTNPVGFLKCDGTTFAQSLYPDLYQVLGNKNKLPDLTRSDVGMTAYFATDNIPQGWIAFDQIRTQVTQSAYPELYRHLVAKYGSISAVPLAEDRFLRNAHGVLTVGQTQEDEFKKHSHAQGALYDVRNDELTNLIFDILPIQGSTARQVLTLDGNPNDNVWMMPKLTSPSATGGSETRPKSLVLKLCIKAKNNLDDVHFWVKAFGSVENTGLIDAGQLGQAIQQVRAEKADLNHLHTANEISDFVAAVGQLFVTQKIGNISITRLPDGTMIQRGYFDENLQDKFQQITFAFAFAEAPTVTATVKADGPYSGEGVISCHVGNITATAFSAGISENRGGATARINWLAIGK